MIRRRQRLLLWAILPVLISMVPGVAAQEPSAGHPVAAKPTVEPNEAKRSPSWMRPLSPAEIDDSLVIGGQDIDARKVRSRMTVAVRVNGKGPYRFVVDSGADSTVIGRRVARELQLPPGEPAVLNTMTESRVVERALLDELLVGPSSVSDLVVPVLDERHIGGEGMIGLDALAEQRLMMDFDKRTISVDDATTRAQSLDGEIVVTARMQRGQLILTQASAQRLKVAAVVDTGSEITIGNLALRDRLVKRRGTKLQTVEITGVTGAVAQLEYATIAELKLGSVVMRNVPMAFADLPPFAVFGIDKEPSLLLGTDLMENFRKVSLDFRARKVRFQLRKCGPTGVRIGTQMSRIGADSPISGVCGG